VSETHSSGGEKLKGKVKSWDYSYDYLVTHSHIEVYVKTCLNDSFTFLISAKFCFNLGIDLKRIEVIPDDEEVKTDIL